MKNTLILTIIFSILAAFSWSNTLIADEVFLCYSHHDQYVVLVESKEDCLEEESLLTLSSSSIKKSDNLTPVANFLENDKCDGEGTKTEIGFDKNSNSSLDQDEIVGSSRSCTPAVAESSE